MVNAEYCPHCRSIQNTYDNVHRYKKPTPNPAVSVVCCRCGKTIRVIDPQ